MPATVIQFFVSEVPDWNILFGSAKIVLVSRFFIALSMRVSNSSSMTKWLMPPEAQIATRLFWLVPFQLAIARPIDLPNS
jgi:hypothetical protein